MAQGNEHQEPSAAKIKRPDLVREWHIAREKADRLNRNLLQYGAAMAAVIGVFGASGGVFALAFSVQREGAELPLGIVWTTVAIGLLLFVILGGFLISAFRERGKREREVEEKFEQISREDPDAFLEIVKLKP
jgi:protein-S-isoprenylcysteine O-methyltransferase Ste14